MGVNDVFNYDPDVLVECKQYCRIDDDFDDVLLKLFIESIYKDLEKICNIDIFNLTARQKIIIYSVVKDLYDNREIYKESTKNELNKTISNLLLKERFGNSKVTKNV